MGAPALLGYPYAMLAGATGLLYLAYGRYEDPSRHERRGPPAGAHTFPALPSFPVVSLLTVAGSDDDAAVTAVAALAATDHSPAEIIVVATGPSADGLDELARTLPITVLRLPGAGPHDALRHAAEHATGEVLAFVAEGTLAAPDAVRRCLRALHRHPELGAVTAHLRARNAEVNPLTRAQDAWLEARCRINIGAEAAIGAVVELPAGLAVCRREAVWPCLPAWRPGRSLAALLVGQPWLGPTPRSPDEPRDGTSAAGRAWQVGYVSSARAYVPVPTTVGGLLTRSLDGFGNTVRSAAFTGRFAWRQGPLPALLHYGRSTTAVTAPVAAGWYLVATPALGWWVGTVLFLGSALVSGIAYGLATGTERPFAAAWAYQPAGRVLGTMMHAALPAYALARAAGALVGLARRPPRPAAP
ncbi:glycosyltransferase [Pilimelia columellifera]|uniref:Glycosyltransferase n=1 Tax=Pilimelia columellifera subsp. columellifera TaxID=706583 RepID=A0ABP6ASH8_9ACTN